jgi:FKBP-type peptidyl-prolyl cis-trans isomerase SlyD
VCLGEGILPAKLEDTFAGRHLGEAYPIDIDAGEQVFGVADDDNTVIFPLSEFPAGVELVTGALFEFDLPHGNVSAGRVIRVEGQEVLVDFNHPLIGKNVSYEIKVVAVQAGSKGA